MGMFTALSLEEARALGARFGLDVREARAIAAGSVNSSFFLSLSSSERVFLRIYERVNREAAEAEARLVDHLARGGVPTPRPLPLVDGSGLIAEHVGKPVAVFPWVEGEPICQRGVTRAKAKVLGGALARVHLAGSTFEESIPNRFRAEDLAARLEGLAKRTDLPRDVAAILPELSARLEASFKAPPFTRIPIIHGDLFRDNALWAGDALTAIIDFESASSGSAAFDLAVTVLSWCFGDALDLELARALVEGYAAERSMPAREREEFYDAAVFAAVRFSITRITDYELRTSGEGTWKDFRRFVARLRALEGLGRARFGAELGL